jgi:hydrogenase maturation protease
MASVPQELGWQAGEKVLVYGIGNPGRQDDGLGTLLVEELESGGLPEGLQVEANYQLNVEDALLVSEFDCVVFVDASADASCQAPFALRPLSAARAEFAFSSHSLSPDTVLALAEKLYGRKPRAFLCALPGYAWEVNGALSPAARENLDATLVFLREACLCMKSRS